MLFTFRTHLASNKFFPFTFLHWILNKIYVVKRLNKLFRMDIIGKLYIKKMLTQETLTPQILHIKIIKNLKI